MNVTSPTNARCAPTLAASTPMADANGASGTLSVTINRECSWAARSDVSWLTITSGASGQGDGSVGYTVAANAVVTARRGNLLVNDSSLAVQQQAAACLYRLDRSERSFDAGGGSQTVNVTAQSGCSWTAVSRSPWVAVMSGGSGNGNGDVRIVVDGNSGTDSRSGSVAIASQMLTIDQAGTPVTPPVPPAPAPTPPEPAPSPTPTPTPPAPTPPAPTPPAPTPPAQELTIEGKVSGLIGTCPLLTFDVGKREVHTLPTTVFTGGNCSKVKKNTPVTVKGALQLGGFVLATRVEIGDKD